MFSVYLYVCIKTGCNIFAIVLIGLICIWVQMGRPGGLPWNWNYKQHTATLPTDLCKCVCVCFHQYSNVLCLYDLYLYLCIWRPSKECKLQHTAALATHSFGHFGFLCLHWDTLEHLGIWRLHSVSKIRSYARMRCESPDLNTSLLFPTLLLPSLCPLETCIH